MRRIGETCCVNANKPWSHPTARARNRVRTSEIRCAGLRVGSRYARRSGCAAPASAVSVVKQPAPASAQLR